MRRWGVGVMMGPAGYMSHMFNGYARILGPVLRLGQVSYLNSRKKKFKKTFIF
jgi:hypothetical protein